MIFCTGAGKFGIIPALCQHERNVLVRMSSYFKTLQYFFLIIWQSFLMFVNHSHALNNFYVLCIFKCRWAISEPFLFLVERSPTFAVYTCIINQFCLASAVTSGAVSSRFVSTPVRT